MRVKVAIEKQLVRSACKVCYCNLTGSSWNAQLVIALVPLIHSSKSNSTAQLPSCLTCERINLNSSREKKTILSYVQYERGCTVQARMYSASKDVQYESGTSSVQARMCSTSEAYLQYERGCAAQIRHIFSTSEDVQYKQVDYKVLVKEALLRNTFQVNDSLLLLIYPIKTVSNP